MVKPINYLFRLEFKIIYMILKKKKKTNFRERAYLLFNGSDVKLRKKI